MFARLQTRRMAAAERDGGMREVIYRLERLAASADAEYDGGDVVIRRGDGFEARLSLSDSVVVLRIGEFTDTLFTCVERMRLLARDEAADTPDEAEAADTLAVTLRIGGRRFTLRLAVCGDPEKRYDREIKRIEDDET